MRLVLPVLDGEIPVLVDDSDFSTIAILAHGAGSHMEQNTIEDLAAVVRQCGVRVVRFNFLYRAQGRGMPDRMPVLMKTTNAVVEFVRAELKPARLVSGGHSMGGRVASMIEAETPTADRLLLFGYPMHPPGAPEKLRDAHLLRIRTRTLCLNGTEDPLCTREIMDRIVGTLDPARWTMHWLEGADHSYTVRRTSGRTRQQVLAEMQAAFGSWLSDQS